MSEMSSSIRVLGPLRYSAHTCPSFNTSPTCLYMNSRNIPTTRASGLYTHNFTHAYKHARANLHAHANSHMHAHAHAITQTRKHANSTQSCVHMCSFTYMQTQAPTGTQPIQSVSHIFSLSTQTCKSTSSSTHNHTTMCPLISRMHHVYPTCNTPVHPACTHRNGRRP